MSWVVTVGLVLACVGLYVVLWVVPSRRPTREPANRLKCASNLKQIAGALLLYSEANRGRYPPDLGALLRMQDLSAEAFICPSSLHTRAPGADVATQAENLSAGGHLSYVYLGKGMTSSEVPEKVLLYEAAPYHDRGDVSVLFADGHVDFFEKGAKQQRLLEELKAGHNPPDLSGR